MDVLGKKKKKNSVKTQKFKPFKKINENLYQKVSIALGKTKDLLEPFTTFDYTETKEGLLQALLLTDDQDLIKLFSYLNRFVPAESTITFFKEYSSRKLTVKPWTYFKSIFEPKYINLVEESKNFLNLRKAVPVKFKIKPIKQIEFLRKMAETGSISEKEKILQDELAAKINVLPAFKGRPQKFMTAEQSVVLYRAAPWLITFTDKSVKAILLSAGVPAKYTIDRIIKDDKGKDWYFASARWYRESWTEGRKFVPDSVAYYLKDKSILVENSDIFNALQKYETSFFSKKSKEKAIINKNALKALLNFYSRASEQYIQDLVNYMANKFKDKPEDFETRGIATVTYLLPVFFKDKQPIHQLRFSREQYEYSTVFNITKEQAFAEVYVDPEHKLKERLDIVIMARLESVKAEYKLLINPTQRTNKATIDYRIPAFNVFPLQLPSDDYIVFNTQTEIGIFMDRQIFLSEPASHKEVDVSHVRFIKSIKDPQNKLKPVKEDQTIDLNYTGFYLKGEAPPSLKKLPDNYLAPGLTDKLRKYLIDLTIKKNCYGCKGVVDIKTALKTSENKRVVYYCGPSCLSQSEE
ncbi:hypothetical protein LDVICp029 [lymphocystis disease virus-China]|uniref:Uncharacterized protein n=2 Tax=Lymphocystis disease virus 2 TaxID=159183 RepID=A0A6F8X2H5_9VIRU|nr:hypothetical protein LDVICp029 [lymphocystis disease virus-China]AAU10877.1 hypothetical protein [lymphocystis disease virus-China]BCB67429.1 hypothetical protein [Lymphocystis disease virus 2]